MILKDISSTPVFYDGGHIVVSIFPHSLAEGIEEETGPPTTGSDREKPFRVLKLARHPLGSH